MPLEEGGSVPLEGGVRRRLLGSLRLSPWDEASLFNGSVEHRCVLEARGREDFFLRIGPPLPTLPPSPVRLTLIQGRAKGGRLDLAIEKGTELGAAAFVVFEARRTVGRAVGDSLEGQATGREARWRRLAVAASEQCGRLRPPSIVAAGSLEEALGAAGPFDLAVVFDPGAQGSGLKKLLAARAGKVGAAAALVGPEGGLAERELEAARDAGFAPVALGPRILRSETAGLTALTLLQYALGDLDG